jgi:hypothetical protein
MLLFPSEELSTFPRQVHVGVLAAIAIKGLPLRGEFLRDNPVLLFPEPLPYDR